MYYDYYTWIVSLFGNTSYVSDTNHVVGNSYGHPLFALRARVGTMMLIMSTRPVSPTMVAIMSAVPTEIRSPYKSRSFVAWRVNSSGVVISSDDDIVGVSYGMHVYPLSGHA